jgi:methyl-accepting chemotaxis protein
MGAVFMVPFAVVTYQMISSINGLNVEFARQESRGLEYYDPLSVLLRDLQQHRGMANAWLSGDASFKDSIASKRADIENGLRKMDEVDQRLNSALHMGQKWTSLSATCRDLLNRTSSLTPSKSFQQHTKVIESTIALIADVGDLSKLARLPQLDLDFHRDTIFCIVNSLIICIGLIELPAKARVVPTLVT